MCAAGEALKRDENGGTSGACRCAKVVAAVMTFPTLTVETFNPASFKADVAGTLGVQPAQVVVNSVVSGSVVVDFHIQPEGVQLTFSDEVTAQVATVLANPTGLTAVYGRVVVESVLTPQQAIAASMSPPPPATPSGDATSPPPASGSKDDGADVGMIAGIAGGGGALILGAGAFLFYKKRKQAVSQQGGDALALQEQGGASA